VKQENSTLQSRVHLLEEQLRDIESQNEEQRKQEERRNREAMARLEKEKVMQSREYVTQIIDLQQEMFDAKENARHYLTSVNKLKEEKERLQDVISSKDDEIQRLQQELAQVKDAVRRYRDEEVSRERICNVLQSELNDLKQIRNHQMHGCSREDHSLAESKITQLELTLSSLRVDNQTLRESNEELQAQLLTSRLEEGRCLIRNGERVTTSLADELVTLNEEQVNIGP
jgi:chromosome segregation ATPase